MTKKFKIFATDILPGPIFKRLTAQGHEIKVWNQERDGIIGQSDIIKCADKCDVLITMLSNKIDRAVLSQLKNLKLITQYAVGYNNIDIEFAKQRGVFVTNTPNVLTKATAELAMALMLTVARNLEHARKNVIDKKWHTWLPSGFIGHSTFDLRLGIIGAGRIGTQFAKMCHAAFDQEVIYSGPNRKTEIEEVCGANHVSLDELLRTSDIISIHCPYTTHTHALLGSDEFAKMKEKVILINTARGEIIDEDAMAKFFSSRPQARAGLDVVCNEPLSSDSPLRELENIYILPHIGSANEVAREEMASLIYENIQALSEQRQLVSPI